MISKSLYIFDLDGTLVDSKDDIALSVNVTLEKLGFSKAEDKVIYSYIGIGVVPLLKDMIGEKNHDRIDEVLEVFKGVYLENLLVKTDFYDGILDIVKDLKDKGKKLAVATNKSMLYTEKIAEGLNFDEYFDVILGGDSTPNMKPAPDMILKALSETSVKPEEALMIGDGVNDILSAQNANVPVVSVGFGMGMKKYLLQYKPDIYCETVNDLRSTLL